MPASATLNSTQRTGIKTSRQAAEPGKDVATLFKIICLMLKTYIGAVLNENKVISVKIISTLR